MEMDHCNIKTILKSMQPHFEILTKGATAQNNVLLSEHKKILNDLISLKQEFKNIQVEFDVLNTKVDFITMII